jgi:hypothetical protein
LPDQRALDDFSFRLSASESAAAPVATHLPVAHVGRLGRYLEENLRVATVILLG